MSKPTTAGTAAKPPQAQPRLDDRKIKPFWDHLNGKNYQGAYDVVSRLEKELPTHTLVISYTLYAATALNNWEEVEKRCELLKKLSPIDMETFNILRFSLKRTPYAFILNDLIEIALKIDPKRVDLLKLAIIDHFRAGLYKKAQMACSNYFTNTKENNSLIWFASIVMILMKQVTERLNLHQLIGGNDQENSQDDKVNLAYQSTLKSQIKQATDINNTFKIVSTLIMRSFDPKNHTQAAMLQAMQKMAGSTDPNKNPLQLNPTWFLQFIQLYVQQGLICTVLNQLKDGLDKVDVDLRGSQKVKKLNFEPLLPIFTAPEATITPPPHHQTVDEVNSDRMMSTSQFLQILPVFSKNDPLTTVPMENVIKMNQLLDSPLSNDFKSKQPQQWNQLKLQTLLYSLTVYDNTTLEAPSPPREDMIPLELQQSRFNEKITEIKSLCLEILKYWPDQWNVIGIYVYISVLSHTNNWGLIQSSYYLQYVLSTLSDNTLSSSSRLIISNLFNNELKPTPHPTSLEPLTPTHTWIEVFFQTFILDFQSTTTPPHITQHNFIDINSIFPTTYPVTGADIDSIKTELALLWCKANTKLEKTTENTTKSVEPSNMTGKFASRGLLLALLEVDRLAMTFNAVTMINEELMNNEMTIIDQEKVNDMAKISKTITIQAINDINLYTLVYLDKPYYWSDLQYFMNQFITKQSLKDKILWGQLNDCGKVCGLLNTIFPSMEKIDLIQFFDDNNINHNNTRDDGQLYQNIIINFQSINQKNSGIQAIHAFALKTIGHYIANDSPQSSPLITTWSDLITLYTNAFSYNLNINYIITDQKAYNNEDANTISGSLLDEKLVTFPLLLLPPQNPSNLDPTSPLFTLKSNPLADPNTEPEVCIPLHHHAIGSYSNALTIGFALKNQSDLFLSKIDQFSHYYLSTTPSIQTATYSTLYQQYCAGVQLLFLTEQLSKKNLEQKNQLQKQVDNFKSTMNHLELPPTVSQSSHDETPAQLGVLGIFLLSDVYGIMTIGDNNNNNNNNNKQGVNNLQPNTFTKFCKSYLPQSNTILNAIYATLQFLQSKYPHEIQSQLLRLKLYSIGSGLFDLTQIFQFFITMSVKEIQWDTLSSLSPTQTSLYPYDHKIATIMAKHVTNFHSDFIQGDANSYEQAFREDNTYHLSGMNGLSQRLLYSTSYFQSFFNLTLHEALFVNPVKVNYNVILDQLYDDDYDLIDPAEESERAAAKIERELAIKEHQEAKNSTSATKSQQKPTTATTTVVPKTAAEKKAAIASAQAKAKNAKSAAKQTEVKAPEPEPKKIYKIEPPINPTLPFFRQHLQLITTKHHNNLTAASIHQSLLKSFMGLFINAKVVPNGRYLPTVLPHKSEESLNISISAPLNLYQLILFISNRQTNDDLTPLLTPSLFPTISSSHIGNPNNHTNNYSISNATNLSQSITTLSPTNTPSSHSLLHPITSTHYLQYQPLGQVGLFPSNIPKVHRDTATSNSLFNDYQFTSDEVSMVLRIKGLFSILILLLSNPMLYPHNNNNNKNGIIIDTTSSSPLTTLPINLDEMIEEYNTQSGFIAVGNEAILPHYEMLRSEAEKLNYLKKINNNIPLSLWIESLEVSIDQYYNLARENVITAYGKSNNGLEKVENEVALFKTLITALGLLTHVTTLNSSDETIINKQYNKIVSDITQVFIQACDILTRVSQQNNNTHFESLISLYTTYLSPIFLLLTQRYNILTENLEFCGFIPVMTIINDYFIQKIPRYSKSAHKSPQLLPILTASSQQTVIVDTMEDKTSNIIMTLPNEINAQCDVIEENKIIGLSYWFESHFLMLQSYHLAMSVSPSFIAPPPLPHGSVDNTRKVARESAQQEQKQQQQQQQKGKGGKPQSQQSAKKTTPSQVTPTTSTSPPVVHLTSTTNISESTIQSLNSIINGMSIKPCHELTKTSPPTEQILFSSFDLDFKSIPSGANEHIQSQQNNLTKQQVFDLLFPLWDNASKLVNLQE